MKNGSAQSDPDCPWIPRTSWRYSMAQLWAGEPRYSYRGESQFDTTMNSRDGLCSYVPMFLAHVWFHPLFLSPSVSPVELGLLQCTSSGVTCVLSTPGHKKSEEVEQGGADDRRFAPVGADRVVASELKLLSLSTNQDWKIDSAWSLCPSRRSSSAICSSDKP